MKKSKLLTYSTYFIISLAFVLSKPQHADAQVSDTTQLIKAWQIDFQKTYDNFPAEVQADFQALPQEQQTQIENNTEAKQITFKNEDSLQSQNLESLLPSGSQWAWVNNYSALQITKPNSVLLVFEVDTLDSTTLTLRMGGNTLYFKVKQE